MRLFRAACRFVQDAKKRLVEKSRIVPSRDAAIARTHAGAKWMRRRVQSAGTEIKPDRGRGRLGKLLLPFHRELALKQFAVRMLSGCNDGRNDWRQFGGQSGE
jgi:hypothetical protein